jgi:hypothetical protein
MAQIQDEGPVSEAEAGAQNPNPWHQQKKKKRPQVYSGTGPVASGASASDSDVLRGVERQAHIWVGRCCLSTTEDTIKSYCSARDVTVESCVKNPKSKDFPDYELVSFHVAVAESSKEKVMKCDFWPAYVIFREWNFQSQSRPKTAPHGSFE